MSGFYGNNQNKTEYIPISELAREFGYEIDHISRLCRQEKLDAIREQNGRWRATRESLAAYQTITKQIKQQVAAKNLGQRPQSLEPSSSLRISDRMPGRVNLRAALKTASKFALLGIFVFSASSSIFAFAKNEELKKQFASLIQNSLPSIKMIQDEAGLTFRIKKSDFSKAKNDLKNLQANIYDDYLSPLLSPLTTLVTRFLGKDEETAELRREVQKLKERLSRPEVTVQANERTIERQIIREIVRQEPGKETIIEKTVVSSSPDLEQRLLYLEEYVNERFSYTPTILVTSGGGGNSGVTVNNAPTTDSETVKVSHLLDVTGDGEIDGKLTVGKNLAVDTKTLYVDSENNRVGIGTSTLETAFEVAGTASISGDLTVLGDIAIGTSSTPFQLTVVGSGSFTGQLKATRNPTLAHTGTWPSFSNTSDATLYLNPSAPAADGNVIAYVSGTSPKFVVDAEGDIYGGSLILTGTTTTGTTTTQGNLTVEGNTQLGDAVGDKIKFVGLILPQTLSSFPLLVKASASQTVDVFRVRDSSDNTLLTLDQGTGLVTASSGFNFAGGSSASVSYSRLGTATTGYSSNIDKFDDLLISGSLETDGSAFFDGKASISSNLQISGRFIADTAASHSFTGDLTISKEFVSSGGASSSFASSLDVTKGIHGLADITATGRFFGYSTASNSFSGSLLISKGFNAAAIVGTGLTINGNGLTTGTFSVNGAVTLGDASGDTLTFNADAWTLANDTNLTLSGGVNGLSFDTNTLSIDATNDRVGIRTTAPSTTFEVQGTASASYLLTGNTLQVGGFSSVAYSRFGTSTTGHSNYISTINDLLISGDLETRGTASFGGVASVSGNFFTYGTNTFSGTGSSSFAGSLLISKGLNALAIVGTGLTVNGNASITGNTTLGDASGDTLTFNADAWTLANDTNFTLSGGVNGLSFDTATFSVDATNDRVGIRTTAPSTTFEVQGTASASYLLTGNTLQVGGFASAAYSRFGTATATDSTVDTTNDLLISGSLEVDSVFRVDGTGSHTLAGEWNFDSNTLGIDSGTNRVGIATSPTSLDTTLEIGGTASISGATTLRGITYTWPSADGSSGQQLQTNGSGALSWAAAGGVSSNSIDFDEIVSTMLLDANLTINRGGYYIGIGAAPSTVFEVQGTASASYLLTGNTLQVGGFASAAYSRFGTNTTGHANYITTTNDLLISGDLEVDGSISAQFASASQIFTMNNTASASHFFKSNGSGGANQSQFSIGVGNGTERLDIFNNDNSPFVTIASSGNVGIGTTAPDAKLTLAGDLSFNGNYIIRRTTSDGSDNGSIEVNGGGATGTSRGGSVKVWGNEATSHLGDVDITNGGTGNINIEATGGQVLSFSVYNDTTGSAATMFVTSGGRIQRSTASSRRYKQNIESLENWKDVLLPLRPVTFNYLPSHLKEGWDKTFYGLIAEEVDEAEGNGTSLVVYDKGRPDNVNYPYFIGPLIRGVQDHESRIASLSFRIEELESIIASQSTPPSFAEASEGTVFDLDILFSSILQKFNEMMGIIFENGLVKVADIITEKLTAKEVAAERLCVGTTCVTEQELKALLEQNGLQVQSTPVPVPEPSPTPESTPESAPNTESLSEPTPSPSEAPLPSPEPTPSPTPEPEV